MIDKRNQSSYCRLRVLAGILAVSLLGTGCAGTEDAASPAPEPSPTTPGEPPSSNTVFQSEWTAGIVDREASGGGVAVLRGVRTGKHADFDRVVFEFEGERPGYHVEYVDRPVRACGSGDVVEVAGDGWLAVRMEPASAHTDAGESTIPFRERRSSYPVLRELQSTCDFEAIVTWVLGVGSPNRYRVMELTNPARLVVDVRH